MHAHGDRSINVLLLKPCRGFFGVPLQEYHSRADNDNRAVGVASGEYDLPSWNKAVSLPPQTTARPQRGVPRSRHGGSKLAFEVTAKMASPQRRRGRPAPPP